MKTLHLFLFLLVFSVSCAQETTGINNELVFRGVNVIPMDKEQVLKNQTVVIKDGIIVSMGDEKQVTYSNDATVIDGKGKFLMPGIAEMHAHVPPVDDLAPMKEVLLLFAAHGITTIRGMLGHPRHLELREKIKSGEITGPRFYTSGPSFSGNSVKTREATDQMVRDQKKAGYDFLKIHPGVSRENFEVLASTAKEVGIRYAGHVPFQLGIWRAIELDYQTIDHLDGFVDGIVPETNISEKEVGLFGMFIADRADTSAIQKLMNGLKAHKVWVVPTQALAERWFTSKRTAESFSKDPEMKYMDTATLRNWVKSKNNLAANPKYDSAAMVRYIQLRKKLILACQKNNVGLLLGCDAPQIFNVPGISTHHELRYLVDAGLTPYEALRTGTVNVAEFYNSRNSGIVANGAVADLVLLNANPLLDISNTKKIEGVLLNGKWLSRSFLDETLKKLEKN